MSEYSAPPPAALPLFKERRFAPLFAGLCLGAFGDNLFRNALVVLIQFRLAQQMGFDAAALVALAPGVFMLPYVLFSTLSGQVADKVDKAQLMRRLKFIDIGLMVLAGVSLILGHITFMFVVLFLAGLQSTFYSPVKYAILPQHLKPEELLTGNALVGAGTYLAILLGTICGGILILVDHGVYIVAAAMVMISILGWISSLFIPTAPAGAPDLKLNFNIITETLWLIRHVLSVPTLGLIILGHSWFWFVSTLYVGQMPSMVQGVLHSTQGVFTLFFTIFSVGIAAGALTVRRMLGRELDGRFTALGALGLAVCGTALAIALDHFPRDEMQLDVLDILTMGSGWLVIVLLGLLSLFAGIYIVPLNALLQARAPEALRARTIAASNIVDSGAMVLASLFASALLLIGLSIPTIWLLVALASFIAIPVIITLIPHMTLKQVFQRLLRAAFDVKIEGLENLQAAGPKAVIVANHVSLLDGLLLAAFLPGRPLFAVNSFIAERWWVKPFLALIEAYRIDPTQPLAMKGLIARVAAGAQCVIFPEGRITTTGALMKINEGPGLIADKAGAPIVPIRIEGAEYTRLSYLRVYPPVVPSGYGAPPHLPACEAHRTAAPTL